jgi:hypothetical protein
LPYGWLADFQYSRTRDPQPVALQRIAGQDGCLEKAMCKFMIQYAGEGRGGYDAVAWCKDKRAWALEDSNGRTVKDYAMSCCVSEVRNEALKSGYQKAYRRMLTVALDEACSTTSFQSHAERTNLKGFRFDDWDEMRFIHACISLGRLDVLHWHEETFYHDNDSRSHRFQGLARYLSSEESDSKCLARVFCSPSEKFSVGDCLEVLGRCYRKQGTNLDGTWMVCGWNLFSNRTYTVKIENGVCRTKIPGLEGATLSDRDSADRNGSLPFLVREVLRCDECTHRHGGSRLYLLANDEGEYWYSTRVNQSIEGAVGMICLKRKSVCNSDGYEFWADNGREIVLSKMDDAAVFASESFIWQRARVVASKNDDLTIEFYEADPPFQETNQPHWMLQAGLLVWTVCYFELLEPQV